MVNIHLNYSNIVKINIQCTEEQASILENYFYGQVCPGHYTGANFQITYKGNIKNRNIVNPEKWQQCDSFRNPSYICFDTINKTRVAYANDQGFNSKHIVVKKGNEFCFFDEERSKDTIIVAICREIVIRQLLHFNFFPMHSSSFSDGNNAIVLFGSRKSGKSSTMIYEIITKKYHLVANDIQFVGKVNGKWLCASIPYDITVGGDFLNAIKIGTPSTKEKIRYTPKQFCEIFNVKQDCLIPIKGMINTRLDLTAQDVKVSFIPEEQREDIYQNQSRENWSFGDPYKLDGDFKFDYQTLAKDIPLLCVQGQLLNYST